MSPLDVPALFRNTVVERDELCLNLLKSSLDARIGLLFGSRQAGKSAVLRRAVSLVTSSTADASVLCDIDVPVYVDLMRLQFDATPGDFFSFLAQQAQDACTTCISGFAISALHSRNRADASPDVFANDIQLLRQCAGEVNVRFVFLLDEAKRILGHRFPRGFQDNLYALLFNPDLGVSDYIAFVFAGAQHLYQFFDDDTGICQ